MFSLRYSESLVIGVCLTFTFEPLPHEAPQHLPAVVAEGGGLVGVDIKGMGSDLEVFNCGLG